MSLTYWQRESGTRQPGIFGISGNTGASGLSRFSPNSVPVSALDRNKLLLTGQPTGTSYSVTNTAFEEVDADLLAGNITSRTGQIKLSFFGIGAPASTEIMSFSATVGGVAVHERGSNGLIYQPHASTPINTLSFTAIAPCVGNKRVALTWRSHTGSACLLYVGTANYCQFIVEEW